MTPKKEQIIQLVDQLIKTAPNEFDKDLIKNAENFIETAINGDTISKMHGIIVSSNDGRKIYVVFALTNVRLIKIEINNDKKSSEEFFLDSIKIEWISNKDDDVKISSETAFFTLKNIDEEDKAFFQAVGEARAKHDEASNAS